MIFCKTDLEERLRAPRRPLHPPAGAQPLAELLEGEASVRRVAQGHDLPQLKQDKVQGDPSGISQPVDINTKVEFQYMLLILKCNFSFDVNMRLGTT